MDLSLLNNDAGWANAMALQTELEMAQMPVEVSQPKSIRELSMLSDEGRTLYTGVVAMNDAMQNATDVVAMLCDLQHRGVLDQNSLNMGTVALESCFAGTGVRMTKPLKMEHFQSDGLAMAGVFDVAKSIYGGAEAVVGGVVDATKAVYRFIKKKVVWLARHVVRLIGSFARNERALESKIRDIEEQLGRVKRTQPIVPYIKAESWCEYLCYTKRSLMKGMEGIHHEVDLLVNEHAKMARHCLIKYLDIMKNMVGGRDGTESLKVNTQEFLLPGMKEFYRSVGLKTPKGDNVFFQTHELPGGRAFYTQVNPVDQSGAAAVDMLDDVDFMVKLHDPRSYEVFKLKLAAAVAMPLSAFLMAINPLIGAAATAATVAYMATRGVDGTGSEVVLDNSTIFECLTLDEVHKRLQEMREGLKSLRAWGNVVLHEPWRKAEIDQLVYGVCDAQETTGNMKSYCSAILSLMNNLTMDVPAYAFKVYNAMGNFCLKSLKQYG